MENTDLSYRDSKYDTGSLVYHPIYRVGIIDSMYYRGNQLHNDSKNMFYDVVFFKNRTIKKVSEPELRKMTFGEFISYKDPYGEWKCGHNSMIPLLLAAVLLSVMSIYSFVHWNENALFKWVGFGGFAIIGIIVLGTYRNWEGKQM